MPWLSPKIYSKLSREELEARLHAPGKRLIVADIDGTLHKGLLFSRYKGITYIDIAIYLLPQLLTSPKHLLRFSTALAKVATSELVERREQLHITQFSEGLVGIQEKMVKAACEKTAGNVHLEAVTTMQKLSHEDTAVYLVSKSLTPMAQAYEKHLGAILGKNIHSCSNPLIVHNDKITGLERLVVTAEQKATHVQRFFSLYYPQQVIAFGDSKEDVPFMLLSYPQQSLRIAFNPKDEKIKEATDVWCWSWQELDELVAGKKTQSRWRKWFFYSLIGGGAWWYLNDVTYHNEVVQEHGKMVHDWMTPSVKKNKVLADFHVHSNRGTSAKELLDKLPKDVDIVTLADKGPLDLSYFEFKQKLLDEHMPFTDKGSLLDIPRQQTLHVGYAQEKRVPGYHLLIVGHTSSLHEKSREETFALAREEGGIIILAHPYSAEEHNPAISWLFPYTLRNEDSEFFWYLANVDAIEAFNAQNQFWMCTSNVKARHTAQQSHLPGTAGSDTHGIIEDVGISGVYFPRDALDFSGDRAFYRSIKNALRDNNYERKEQYASPFSFFTTIAAPWISWRHYALLAACLSGMYIIKRKLL